MISDESDNISSNKNEIWSSKCPRMHHFPPFIKTFPGQKLMVWMVYHKVGICSYKYIIRWGLVDWWRGANMGWGKGMKKRGYGEGRDGA